MPTYKFVLETTDSAPALVAESGGGGGGSSIYFNVKDYGAVGNGSTNDATSIQSAIDAAGVGGGRVYFPPGSYRVDSTLNVDATIEVILEGDGMGSCIFTNSDIALITVENTRHILRNLQLLGFGISGGNGVSASSTSHVIHVKNTAVDALLSRLFVVGGYDGVRNEGVDTTVEDVMIYNNYGVSLFSQHSIALWMRRCKLDNPWPVASPVAANIKGNRANSTAYSVNDVTISGGFYIQCRVAGTSGAIPPTLQNHGTDITDGTAKWRLACRSSSRAMYITTGASEVHISQTDFTGAQDRVLVVDNAGAGVAPFFIISTDNIFSGSVNSTIAMLAGAGLMFSGNEVAHPIVANECALGLQASWAGDASIVNNIFFGSSTTLGVYLAAGNNCSITGNTFAGWSYGILVDAGPDHFIVSANNFSSSSRFGTNTRAITINSGSNYFNVVNNVVHGCSVSGVTDSSGGANKTISGNV